MTTTVTTDEFLEHFGIRGMHWGVRNAVDSSTGRVSGSHTAKPVDPARAAKREARNQRAVARGKDRLTEANAFHNPSYAVGKQAIGLLLAAGSLAFTIKDLRSGDGTGAVKNIKRGFAAVSALMTVSEVVSTARDIHDINAYRKSTARPNSGK